jgi:aspartate/methionine/tyrosine aminotransferase
MKPTSTLFSDIPTSIFTTMSAIAIKHDAINLGQGFPGEDGPLWLREEAAKAIIEGPNQYPPMPGLPELRNAVANANKRFYGLDIDPDKEVLITSGATEALADSFFGLLNEGDEAIVIEPFFDCYVPQILAAGGVPKFIRLEAPDWELNENALSDAFSKKTKLIVLNTPLNPVAKVFKKSELELIARFISEYDAYAVCDEVYEHLLFDDHKHIPLMTLPGMKERCVRIGSAGKTFSFTGWKTGYVTAPEKLLKAIAGSHQFVTFATAPHLQKAVAKGLASDDEYYKSLPGDMDEPRLILSEGLKELGFKVFPCEGTYFLIADFSPVAEKIAFKGNDFDFCVMMTEKAGVTAVPLSPFYDPSNGTPPSSLIRFCFAKDTSMLNEALKRIKSAFS